jgi:trehalose/maltose transport system substrate-binding protein
MGRRRSLTLVFGSAFALMFAMISSSSLAETLAIACGSIGNEQKICQSLSDEWGKKTGNTVKVIPMPPSDSDRLALYQQLFGARSPDIDLFEIDTIWPGILGSDFIDLKPYSHGAEAADFPSTIENDTRDGKLVALPLYVDAGLLYYRRDLLDKYHAAVPRTWSEMTATAKRIEDAERAAGDKAMWGYVFQGKAYEGLTCNALEWISSNGGGTFIDPKGEITVDNPKAAGALDQAAAWIRTIAPEGVLNYTEEESRGVFQSGHAVFMRNWPYALALANSPDSAVRGKVGVAPLPQGEGDGAHHAAALGGWQIAVSRFSRHPKLAADLAVFLAGREGVKVWALEGGYTPAIPSLYQDPDVKRANPNFSLLLPIFQDAVARPSAVTGSKYDGVSNAIWNAVTQVITGDEHGAEALASLKRQLHRVERGGW